MSNKLFNDQWKIKCETPEDASKVLRACQQLNIKWANGVQALSYIPNCFGAKFYISKSTIGLYYVEEQDKALIRNFTDITKWFFESHYELPFLNQEEYKAMRIILGKIRGEEVDVLGTDNQWHAIDTVRIGKSYVIKSK